MELIECQDWESQFVKDIREYVGNLPYGTRNGAIEDLAFALEIGRATLRKKMNGQSNGFSKTSTKSLISAYKLMLNVSSKKEFEAKVSPLILMELQKRNLVWQNDLIANPSSKFDLEKFLDQIQSNQIFAKIIFLLGGKYGDSDVSRMDVAIEFGKYGSGLMAEMGREGYLAFYGPNDKFVTLTDETVAALDKNKTAKVISTEVLSKYTSIENLSEVNRGMLKYLIRGWNQEGIYQNLLLDEKYLQEKQKLMNDPTLKGEIICASVVSFSEIMDDQQRELEQ